MWAAIWLFRKDLRKKILLTSTIIAPLGPISEIWYFEDYWSPPTIANFVLNIEDILFTFALGGITFSLYKFIFKARVSKERMFKRRIWFIYVSVAVTICSLVVFSSILKINSIIVSVLSFWVLICIIWFVRNDLIIPSLLSGFFLLTIFLLVYKIMFALFPNLGQYWCKDCNPTGILILGVNIEELLWDYSWGTLGGVLYEFISGRGYSFTSERDKINVETILSNFLNYDTYLNRFIIKNNNSILSNSMYSSTHKVLLIRLTRQVSYFISKLAGFPLSSNYGIIFIALFPFMLDLPFSFLNFNTTGIALNWVLFYTLLTFCLLKFSQDSWLALMQLTDSINELLPTDFDRNLIKDQINRHLNFNGQVVASIICSVVGTSALIYLSPFFSQYLRLGFASYFQVCLNAFLGMNAIYWFWLGPLYNYRLKSIGDLSLCWYSPTDTPAISGLSTLLANCAIKSIIGLILTLFPLFYYINKIANHQIIYISTFLFSLSISAVISISFFPQYWLVQIVKKQKQKILAQLRLDIELAYSNNIQADIDRKVALYHNIKRSPYSVIDIKSVASYVFALFLAVFPYIFKHLPKFTNYLNK